MKASIALTFGIPILALVSTAEAQRPHYANEIWVRPAPIANLSAFSPKFLGDGAKDHRYTGFYVGVGVGILGTVSSAALCNRDNSPDCPAWKPLVYGPLVSAGLGVVGALIGSAIPKRKSNPSP